MTTKIILVIYFFPQGFPKEAGVDIHCYVEGNTHDKMYFSLSFGELEYFAIKHSIKNSNG